MWCATIFLLLSTANLITGQQECEAPFQSIHNACYWLNTQEPVSWTTAQGICRSQNAELVVLETEEEWDALKAEINPIFGKCNEWTAWIGSYSEQGRWVWAPLGVPLFYQDWLDDEQPPADSAQAVVTTCDEDYKWDTMAMQELGLVFCEKPRVRSPCPFGYIEVEGIGCYFIDSNEKPFSENLHDCGERGGKLVEIETAEEWDAMRVFLNDNICSRSVHVGGAESGINYDFRWVSTNKTVEVFHWAAGNPNIDWNVDDVLYMFQVCDFNTTLYGIGDTTKNFARPSICEYTPKRRYPINYDDGQNAGGLLSELSQLVAYITRSWF